MSRIDLSTTLWKKCIYDVCNVYVYKKCTIKINNYIKTKKVNRTYAFFPQDISDSQNSVRNSHHKTPSQLVAPVAFDSISQLPILAARDVSVTGAHNLPFFTYDDWLKITGKVTELAEKTLEFFNWKTNQIKSPSARAGKPEFPDTFLDLRHFLICFFHLRYWKMPRLPVEGQPKILGETQGECGVQSVSPS